MEDLNLHILIFSVILACAQSFNHMRRLGKEDIVCEDSESDDLIDIPWSKFANQPNLPNAGRDIRPTFHLCKRGLDISHLVVLMHGFNSKSSAWAAPMSEEIFRNDRRPNLAVLTVDWRKGAGVQPRSWFGIDLDPIASYNRAAANTRYVGVAAARFIADLALTGEGRVHCIGHSLGAHTCGFLANALEDGGMRMWRITGLDPAGPQFTTERVSEESLAVYQPLLTSSVEERLDPSDAELVDVVHTDGEQWGTMVPLGDVDFYVGKSLESFGRQQAGCEGVDSCDHTKAIHLFRDSLRKKQQFDDIKKCEVGSDLVVSKCKETKDKPMFGYFYKSNMESGVFGVLEKEEEKVDEWADWWQEELTKESTTTTSLNPETTTGDKTTSMRKPEDANADSWLNIGRTNVILIAVTASVISFLVFLTIVWLCIFQHKAKFEKVPDCSNDAKGRKVPDDSNDALLLC